MNVDKMFIYNANGLDKKWIYKAQMQLNLSYDYIQKLNYDYEDYYEYKDIRNIKGRKDVFYLVLLATWIIDTCDLYGNLIHDCLMEGFVFSRTEELKKAKNYLKALRAICVAHQLQTNKHATYGFDGDFVCVDIGYPKKEMIFKAFNYQRVSKISLEGSVSTDSIDDCDFCLTGYSKKDGAEFYKFIGFNKKDIDECVHLCKAKMQELDKYLRKKKKKDFINLTGD